MNETFLTFLWRNKLFKSSLYSFEDEEIEIIFIGEHNVNAGPDFINAKIKIGQTLWVGNIEIHTQSSDWFTHNHDKNAAYDNVILHVVNKHNQDIYNSKGRKIPTIELKFDPKYWSNFEELKQNKDFIPCASKITSSEIQILKFWLNALVIEKLSKKTILINDQLNKTSNHWEEIFYQLLLRSFGFHINSQPFELLSQKLPYKIIQKHQTSLFQIECLLFGMGGFLQNDYSDDIYYNNLKNEFTFLKSKYNLNPVDNHTWKFLRIRPANFPTIRLAQLSGLFYYNTALFQDLLNAPSVKSLQNLLVKPIPEFWNTHFTFNQESNSQIKTLGINSANLLILNAIIPFLFVYGRDTGQPEFEDKALQLLEKLPAEKNTQINSWAKLNIKPQNAFDSQALLYLKSNYCDKIRCDQCRIGTKIISK